MPLLKFWQDSPDTVLQLEIKAIVANAGRLLDASNASQELRAFLRDVDSNQLETYVSQCLASSAKEFPEGGIVLQDIVNELGNRLDFAVTHGLYQGRHGAIGFDGIWKPTQGPSSVIEVKTSGTYTLDLEKYHQYRTELMAEGQLKADSPVVFVVGRHNTGALEAQIRGSRHSWSMRWMQFV